MYERRNEYLRRKEERERKQQERSRMERDSRGDYNYDRNYDQRNPYGSQGGYVDSRMNYGTNDSRRDYNKPTSRYGDDYRQSDYRGDYYGGQYDTNYGMDYHTSEEQKYKDKLREWTKKLEREHSFNATREEILKRAKDMGVSFGEYDEDEFYAIYLLMVSMHKSLANDYNIYVKMAKEFLEEKGIKVSPSDKVAIYLYSIVNGEY